MKISKNRREFWGIRCVPQLRRQWINESVDEWTNERKGGMNDNDNDNELMNQWINEGRKEGKKVKTKQLSRNIFRKCGSCLVALGVFLSTQPFKDGKPHFPPGKWYVWTIYPPHWGPHGPNFWGFPSGGFTLVTVTELARCIEITRRIQRVYNSGIVQTNAEEIQFRNYTRWTKKNHLRFIYINNPIASHDTSWFRDILMTWDVRIAFWNTRH